MSTNDPQRDLEPSESPERDPKNAPSRPARGRPSSAQLSGARRVTADVSSIALDRVMLVGGAAQRPAEPPAGGRAELREHAVLEILREAEVMLRVAVGDNIAFDFLVEKYRRPMVSFMYRMTHNQSV